MTSAKTVLRIRLAEASLRTLKDRALIQGLAVSGYSEMIFRYLLYERSAAKRRPHEVGSAASDVYFPLEISPSAKERIANWSRQSQTSVAAFAGELIVAFIAKFEKDPRDLPMIHYLSVLLEEKALLSEADLREAMNQCAGFGDLKLAPGYLPKWFYSRLRPLLPRLERNGERLDLTAGVVEAILKTTEHRARDDAPEHP